MNTCALSRRWSLSTVAFDFAGMSGRDRYKLLANTILPRPIALVVSESGAGLRNAAPFSFFNVFSEDPPVVILGVGAQSRRPGQHKDTTRNIEETGEFTINLVDEALVPQMGICSIDFPSATDELAVSKLETIDSLRIKPPRIAASPVQLECSRTLTLSLGGSGRTLIVGEVLVLHAAESAIDPATLRVDHAQLGLVGRVGSGGWYSRTRDLFQVKDPTLEEWEAGVSEG